MPKIDSLITVMLAARTKAAVTIYLARDLYPSKKDPDPDEFVEVIKMPFEKAYKMFVSGKVPTTSYTIIAFLLADRYLRRP